MPVDSAGNATRPPSPIPVSGQDADAPQVNVPIDDIYSILNLLTFLDGRKSLRGNIPMNGYRATGAGNAVQPQDYVTLAQLQAAVSAGIPTGVMQPYTISSEIPPDGWVFANGQTLSRATFSNLWAAVQGGNNLAATQEAKQHGQYGPGDGSTTFTLPNLYADGGYFIRPISSGRGIGSVQGDENKSHVHSGTANPAGGHNHSITGGGATLAVNPGDQIDVLRAAGSLSTTSVNDHSHSLAISASGGTESRPKNIAFPVIIKA